MEDEAKSKILNDNGVAMGVVTPEMLKGMQDATKPMVASFMEANPKAKMVIEDFWKAVGR